ncbi:MAG: hypothetical protein KAT00_05800 [Planctomycetes bacterium]|nr:hypothetical protein [Planctomycetota bacterium]
MPNIREYGQSVSPLTELPTRRATAEDFGAGAARGIAGLGNAMGALGETMERAKTADNLATLERVKSEHNSALLESQFQLKNDPDYIDNPDKFNDISLKLQEDAQKRLGEIGMFDKYVTDMNVAFERTGITVRQDTVNRVTQNGKVALNQSLDTYSSLAATSQDEAGQEKFLLLGGEAISSMVEAGVLNPAEEGKIRADFAKNTRTAIVGNMIDGDPLTTSVMATQRIGIFADMPEAERQTYQDAAIKEYREALRFEQGQEDRRRQETERAEEEVAENTAKVLDEGFINGTLTLAEVQAEKSNLDAADYRFQLDRAVTGRKATTDAPLYSDLLLRAMRGENIKEEAKGAYRNYQLERGAFDHILGIYNSKNGFGASGTPDKFKKAEEYVEKATKPNELNPSAGSARRQADALKMLWNFMRENPNITEQEALEQATGIVDRFSIVDQGAFSINTPTPKLMVGTRNSIDIASTLEATDRAFNQGKLTRREYLKELDLLDKWDVFNDDRQRKAGEQ